MLKKITEEKSPAASPALGGMKGPRSRIRGENNYLSKGNPRIRQLTRNWGGHLSKSTKVRTYQRPHRALERKKEVKCRKKAVLISPKND